MTPARKRLKITSTAHRGKVRRSSVIKKFILAAIIGPGIAFGFATHSFAVLMTFTGTVTQVNVTSNAGNFAVGDLLFGTVALDGARSYSVNVGDVNIAEIGGKFETQIQNDPTKGFVLYHLQFFSEPAFPYASADGGFDLVGYSPTGTRPPIDAFAINDFSVFFHADFDGDGHEEVDSVFGHLTALAIVPDGGRTVALLGVGLTGMALLRRLLS